MELVYNSTTYSCSSDSIGTEMIIPCDALTDAVDIIETLADMSEYTFDGEEFSNMFVRKRAAVADGDAITAKIYLRKVRQGGDG